MTATATAEPASSQAGRLSLSQYLGYAGGDVANNLTFSLASMFLLLISVPSMSNSAAIGLVTRSSCDPSVVMA